MIFSRLSQWITKTLHTVSTGCDPACVGCMGSGPARCRKCAVGYRLTGAKCLGNFKLYHYILSLCFICSDPPARDDYLYISGVIFPDIDECSERVLACHGLDEICTNTEGSFSCDCADAFIRKDSVCVRKQMPSKLRFPSSLSLSLTHTHTHAGLFANTKPCCKYPRVHLPLQVIRRKVSLRTSRTRRWWCCSRCSSAWCFVLWPRWRLKEIWSSPPYSWELWQPWQVTGSLTGETDCWTAS